MNNEHNYIAIEGYAKTYEEAISLCADALCKEGYVDKNFAKDCIDREKEFPTGLCTEIPVAIPHCKSTAIKKSAVCYLRLKEPVDFYRMDDDEEIVQTRNIFNIAIIGSENHLEFLQQMIGLATNKEILQKLENTDIKDIPEMLRHSFSTSA